MNEPLRATAPDMDPGSRGGRRGGPASPLFWLSLGSGLTCVLAAIAFVLIAPHLTHGPTPPATPATSPPPPATAATPATAPAPIAPSLTLAAPPGGALAQAAEFALAAANISEAAESGRPFPRQMTVVAALAPTSRAVQLLAPVADRGAPTLAVLTAEFPETARRAAYASRAPAKTSGFWARLSYGLNVLFTVRRTDHLSASDPDAILARAEHQLYEGDLEAAIHTLDALPAKGRDAASAWLDRAKRRLQVQTALELLREDGLQALENARRISAMRQGGGQ